MKQIHLLLLIAYFNFIFSKEETQKVETFQYRGIDFIFSDLTAKSITMETVKEELFRDEYYFEDFKPIKNDVMIDIGAHIGIISIVYAKLYPNLLIYAFEPVLKNYESLIQNIKLNSITNIIPYNLAVTSDGRDVTIFINEMNTGGSGLGAPDTELSGYYKEKIKSISLDCIFSMNKIDRCKVLKIDCEGSEYDILPKTNSLDKIEYLIGEFHEDLTVDHEELYTIEGLLNHCLAKNKSLKIKIQKFYNKN